MNEVEKMYSNANIKQDRMCEWTCRGSEFCSANCEHYESTQLYYPPFTAEKQIAILKIFSRRYLEVSQHVEKNGDLCFGIKATVGDFAVGFNKDFAECLADFVNSLWQDLSEEERKQIKEILE